MDYKESWVWCWRRLLRVPWTARRSNQSILNKSWIFTGRTDAKAEALILWPPDVKNWLIGKDPDAGKDWRQEEKGMTEDEMVRWHHWLNEHEFEQAPGVGDGQGRLACCSPWGCKESDMTERLHFPFSLPCIGEGNGNPLQCSCLENPRDGGAWWAAIYGVTQSRTRLKRLSSSSSNNWKCSGFWTSK